MNIFPHIVTRIGGAPFSDIHINQTSSLGKTLTLLADSKLQYENKIAELSQLLLEFNQQVEDKKLQNTIQNFRRDIFNKRQLKPAAIQTIRDATNDNIREALVSYLEIQNKYADLQAQAANEYREVSSLCRKNIQQLGTHEYLQKALLLASQDLSNNLDSYLKQEEVNNRKQGSNIELSLWKYISRSCVKTSPFSLFTNICLAETGDVENIESITAEGNDEVISFLRLNNHLYKYLRELLISDPLLKRKFSTGINPTISKQEDHFLYLTNFNNLEAFQRMQVDAINDYLFEVFSADPRISYQQLLDKLVELTDAPEADIEGYVDGLISYGFLEFHIPVSGLDPEWDIRFVEYLDEIFGDETDDINALRDMLTNLRKISVRYALSGTEERKGLLIEAFQSFRSICQRLHERAGTEFKERTKAVAAKTTNVKVAAGEEEAADNNQEEEAKAAEPFVFKRSSNSFFQFKPETMFYEDSIRDVRLRLPKKNVEEFITKLNFLYHHIGLPDGKKAEEDELTWFFLANYDKDAHVPLTVFYEDFSKYTLDKEKKEKEEAGQPKEKQPEKNNGKDDANKPVSYLARSESWRNDFTSEVLKEIESINNCIDLSLDRFAGFSRVTETTKRQNGAKSIFVQFFEETDPDGTKKLMGVLNGGFQGFGKIIGRFLHLFDKKVTDDLKAHIKKTLAQEDTIYAENCDASFFNANIHPSLMEHELCTPGSNNMQGTASQVRVADISVKFNSNENRAELIHNNTNQRVCLVDLGLQSPLGRSALYRLLEKFNTIDHTNFLPFVHSINMVMERTGRRVNKDGIKLSPRIVIDGQIIMQRKNWMIPAKMIPLQADGCSDYEYFMQVNEWRKQLGICDEVFIKIYMELEKQLPKDQKSKSKRDDYKPQYVNFLHPVSVKLFEKIGSRVSGALIIEEMLPASNQILQVNNNPFVTEFVLHWSGEANESQQVKI